MPRPLVLIMKVLFLLMGLVLMGGAAYGAYNAFAIGGTPVPGSENRVYVRDWGVITIFLVAFTAGALSAVGGLLMPVPSKER